MFVFAIRSNVQLEDDTGSSVNRLYKVEEEEGQEDSDVEYEDDYSDYDDYDDDDYYEDGDDDSLEDLTHMESRHQPEVDETTRIFNLFGDNGDDTISRKGERLLQGFLFT